MTPALKQKLKGLWPYLFALILALVILSPTLFLDFRADDYHFFRLYSGQELSYFWTHSYDIDNIENDGLRPIWMFIFHVVTLIGGFNYAWIGFVTLLVVAIKILLSVKLASYFIKDKALLLATVFLSATSYCLVSHQYMATEIPANVCIILVLSSLILLLNAGRTRYKYASFIGSLALLFLGAFTKEIAVPFLLVPPLVFAYLARSGEAFGFKAIKDKAVFLAACCLPLFYLFWRLIFFHSDEYQVPLMTHVHYFFLGLENLFNILYIYSYRHNLWRPEFGIIAQSGIIITYLFDLILLAIGLLMLKNIKKIFSDKFNILLVLLIALSFVIFPVNGGGRLQFLYLLFSFILIGRFMESSVIGAKWRKAFLASALVMIAANIGINFSNISETMSPSCPDVIAEDLRVFNNIGRNDGYQNNEYLLRDEYRDQLQYLKARIEKEKDNSN